MTIEEHKIMTALQSIAGKLEHVELRDLFAMSALNGLARLDVAPEDASVKAYKYADAMLEAKNKKSSYCYTLENKGN